jgi:hypothetical protein
MWCIGALTQEYRDRMYALLELYARPMSKTEPVICIDEKSLQFIGRSRAPLPMTTANPTKQDYEYVRNGTTNLFVAVEPKGGKRVVSVTERRGKIDFVAFINGLLTGAYAKARRIHLVLDNLNTHFRKCFDDVLGVRAANVEGMVGVAVDVTYFPFPQVHPDAAAARAHVARGLLDFDAGRQARGRIVDWLSGKEFKHPTNHRDHSSIDIADNFAHLER